MTAGIIPGDAQAGRPDRDDTPPGNFSKFSREPRTTHAVLMCDACKGFKPHRFSHRMANITHGFAALMFTCVCGALRRWGNEAR